MRIGLFVTCLTDTLFPGTGQAVVAVLERLGHQVDFPAAQACCGQMHFNTGYRREAVPMARGFTAAFAGDEAIVTPSASCASMIREYYPALAAQARDPGLARAVAEVAPRTHELSVFLTGVHLRAKVVDAKREKTFLPNEPSFSCPPGCFAHPGYSPRPSGPAPWAASW